MVEEVKMKKSVKKTGHVHYVKTKSNGNNPPLEKMEGCKGCVNTCMFNRTMAHPDMADDAFMIDYPCKRLSGNFEEVQ